VRDASAGRRRHHAPVWHDGPERPLPRPTGPAAPQAYSRGQKKCHTHNNRLVINAPWPVGFLSHTSAGNASAKSLAELAGSTVPPGSGLEQDQGFQGCGLQDVTIGQPKKTPPGGALTPPEKAPHRRMASIRIRIDPALGGVKRSRIVKDNIRLLKDGIRDAVLETCCGLHNFRLQYRSWH
jgi:hypothetical protein